MKMQFVGKYGGRFTNDNGDEINYHKVFLVKPSRYVEQVNISNKIIAGGECGAFSCFKEVFDVLPDDAKSYDDGLFYDVEFDDKKRVIDIRDIVC